jgi:hypothetical protein
LQKPSSILKKWITNQELSNLLKKMLFMKNAKFAAFASGIVALGLSAFTLLQTTSIKGTVSPADKAVKAWAISSSDTLSAPVTNGAFQIQNVKAGDYSVIIEAQSPYANTRKKDVVVKDGQTTDVGEIQLQQK